MRVAIVDYGSGNLRSAQKAFQRVAAEAPGGGRGSANKNADGDIVVTSDPDAVAKAERVVLPGVGAFADCRRGLQAVDGMFEAIDARVQAGHPFLGICVGMQLMAARGFEHGTTSGFGWIPGEAVRLEPGDPTLRIPHIGWNELAVRDHPLFDGIEPGAHAYFVHSYHLQVESTDHRIAETDYGQTVTAAVARDNMAGTQFHPEKSQATGLRLIANFLAWEP